MSDKVAARRLVKAGKTTTPPALQMPVRDGMSEQASEFAAERHRRGGDALGQLFGGDYSKRTDKARPYPVGFFIYPKKKPPGGRLGGLVLRIVEPKAHKA